MRHGLPDGRLWRTTVTPIVVDRLRIATVLARREKPTWRYSMNAIVEPTESIGAPRVDDPHQAVGGDLLNSVAVIVDDDRPRLVEVAIHVVDRGSAVRQSRARSDAMWVAIDPTVDAIILDLGQRPTNHLDLIHAVRRYSATPIVVLSERSGPRHRVAAPDLGADDYITKPSSMEEPAHKGERTPAARGRAQ